MAVVDMQSGIRPFTLNDIDVGSCLYSSIVVEAKKSGGVPIYYSALLEIARKLYPTDKVLEKAVPIGIGYKLLFVEMFCRAYGYPNLACLAVSRADDEPGGGYQGDWPAEMQAVRAFDWEAATPELDDYANARRAVARPLKKVKSELAALQFYTFYKAHGEYKDRISKEEKQEIIDLIIEGHSEDEAFKRVKI